MKKTIRSEGGFTPESVERLREQASTFLKLEKVPGPQAYSIVTVVDEVACNILEHAQASFLELEIATGLGQVELRFLDDGTPFDPTERVRQQVALMPGDAEERKLGLYMVASLGDGLRYERLEGKNELMVVLPSDPGAGGERLSINTEAGGDGKAWRVHLTGKVDVFTFTKLKQALEAISAKDAAAKIAVDLAQVPFVASSGWSVLLARRKLGRATGGDLAVCNMNAEIRRVYDAMRIKTLLPLATDLAAACALLEGGQA